MEKGVGVEVAEVGGVKVEEWRWRKNGNGGGGGGGVEVMEVMEMRCIEWMRREGVWAMEGCGGGRKERRERRPRVWGWWYREC